MNQIERRILAYLDQHGGSANRMDIVCDLSSPDSRIGRGILNGSNAGVPRLFGAWAKRLLKEDLIRRPSERRTGLRSVFEITDTGRKALRA